MDTASSAQSATAQGPLHGLRVVELGHYLAAPLAGLLLADQGADVVAVQRPAGAAQWGDKALHAFLTRNKRVVTADFRQAEGRAHLLDLLANADVLIENFRPGVLARHGLGADEVRVRNPRLVYLSLPGFASTDAARAALPAWEGIIGASAGLYTDVSVPGKLLRGAPIYTGLPLASVYGAVHGATAVLAALLRRDRDGRGSTVEVPLREALLAAMGSAFLQVQGQPWRYDVPPLPKAAAAVALPLLRLLYRHGGAGRRAQLYQRVRGLIPPLMNTYRCADGEQLYLFAVDNGRLTRALLRELGLLDALRAAGATETDPYQSPPDRHNLLNASTLTTKHKAGLREKLTRAFLAQPAEVWEQRLNAAGVPCAVHRDTQAWLRLPELRALGLTVSAPSSDPARVQPGLATWLSSSPPDLLTPRPAAPTNSGWGVQTAPAPVAGPAEDNALPLKGLRVLDLSSMVAGPVCGRTLAEYGAEVTKIEAPRPQHGPLLTCWYGIEVNRGKQSLILDLGSPAGQQVFATLLAKADVVLHNFRPLAAARLGLSLAALRAHHPRLIVSGISAYDGPHPAQTRSNWPGYDPVLQAASGIMTRYGTPAQPELHAIASCVDYLTGYLTTYGTLLALHHRQRTGRGDEVKTTLATAALYAQVPFAQFREHYAPESGGGPAAVGPAAGQRLYQARDQWVFLGTRDAHWPALLAALHLTASAADAAQPHGRLAHALAGALRQLTVAELQARLQGLDVAVVPVLSLANLVPLADPAVRHEPAHPCGYPVTSLQPNYRTLDGASVAPGRPCPPIGHDTVAVLTKSGLAPAAIAELLAAGVVAERLAPTYLPA